MTVSTESVSGARSDLVRLVEWLDEQRQLDHERLTQLARVVDQMRANVRDQAATLTHVETTASSKGVGELRSGEESVGKVADHVVLIERTLGEHIETQSRTAQAEAALRDRERRQFAELAQQVDVLNRSVEAANGRALALAEEVRHERDSRPPIVQAVDELQRGSTGVNSRIAALDQTVRRLASAQALFEQSEDKRWSDLARVDQQVKLLDLRLTRDLAEIRKVVDDSRTSADETLKPVDLLRRLVNQLVQDHEVLQTRVVGLGQGVDELADMIARVEAQARSDRAAVDRLGESCEQLTRRLEANGASIWQLGERATVEADDLNYVRGDVRQIREQADGLTRRLEKLEDERRRIDGVGHSLESEIQAVRKEAREAVASLSDRLDVEVDTLAVKADVHRQVGLEHLRRTIDELAQQLRELEADNH